jgi:hypothetical protein
LSDLVQSYSGNSKILEVQNIRCDVFEGTLIKHGINMKTELSVVIQSCCTQTLKENTSFKKNGWIFLTKLQGGFLPVPGLRVQIL